MSSQNHVAGPLLHVAGIGTKMDHRQCKEERVASGEERPYMSSNKDYPAEVCTAVRYA